jgi:hypothetical protein
MNRVTYPTKLLLHKIIPTIIHTRFTAEYLVLCSEMTLHLCTYSEQERRLHFEARAAGLYN